MKGRAWSEEQIEASGGEDWGPFFFFGVHLMKRLWHLWAEAELRARKAAWKSVKARCLGLTGTAVVGCYWLLGPCCSKSWKISSTMWCEKHCCSWVITHQSTPSVAAESPHALQAGSKVHKKTRNLKSHAVSWWQAMRSYEPMLSVEWRCEHACFSWLRHSVLKKFQEHI